MRRKALSFVLAVGLAGVVGWPARAAPQAPVATPTPAPAWLSGRWARPESAGYLELTWTELGGRWRGVLASVQREQPRRTVATYDLEASKAGWTLRLQEGKRRWLFPRGSAPGDQHLRFERRGGGAGPQAVDLRIIDGKLFIAQSASVQGGAGPGRAVPASTGLWLERASSN